MGKAGRWLKSFLSGKKDRPQAKAMQVLALPPPTPNKKRWSFWRPVPAGKSAAESPATGLGVTDEGLRASASSDIECDQKKQAVAVAVATAAAAHAAVAAAHAAAKVVRLSSRRANLPASLVEDTAAVRIQATFRGYLARMALCALRGIVKLQALVRGQLVRKQANATLRCMQARLAAQCQLRAQRMRVLQEHHQQPPPRPRLSSRHPRHRRSYEMDGSCEDNAKIVEMDIGEPVRRGAVKDGQLFVEYHGQCSPGQSAMTEPSPRAYSGHFDKLSLATAQSSPQHGTSVAAAAMTELCPSYMANTESSRAKARSQSAPRQRTDALERQPSRRKGTPPRISTARMQRSSSQAGAPAPRGGAQSSPWWSSGVRLNVSNASLKDSECGSTSSVLTAATVYSRTRSLVGFEVHRGMY